MWESNNEEEVVGFDEAEVAVNGVLSNKKEEFVAAVVEGADDPKISKEAWWAGFGGWACGLAAGWENPIWKWFKKKKKKN